MTINTLNNILYTALKNSNDENIKKITDIYTYLPKNAKFPYLFIEYKNIAINNSYENDIYCVVLNLHLYDKNTSNTNILSIYNSVKNILETIENSDVIDISINNIENKFDNNNQYFDVIIQAQIIIKE